MWFQKRGKNGRLNGVTTIDKSSSMTYIKLYKHIIGLGIHYWIQAGKMMSKSGTFSLFNYYFIDKTELLLFNNM